jgi:hypothetical protein
MATNRGIKAWLVTWEHIGEHLRPEQRIAAIINSRRSADRVREIVELLYATAVFTPGEQLLHAGRRFNPYPAEFIKIDGADFTGEITCGHNPWLRARLVENLRYRGDGRTESDLTWVDQTEHVIKKIREWSRNRQNGP